MLMTYKASGAAYKCPGAPIYYTLGNSRPKGSSSAGRRGDTDLSSDPRLSANGIDGLAAAGHALHDFWHS